MPNAMQMFTVQIPPDSLRRSAPNWIWITMASILALPLAASARREDDANDRAHGEEEALSQAVAGILARENRE